MTIIDLVVGNGIERIADDVRMDLGIDPTIHHISIGADEPYWPSDEGGYCEPLVIEPELRGEQSMWRPR